MLVASYLGTSIYADVNNIAMRFPNFFRSIFAEGAFNPAFIPLYSEKLAKEGSKSAAAFANQIFTFLMIILLVFTIIIEIFMPQFMHVFAPGFATIPEKFALTVTLSRITFPYLILISAVSCISCLLNAVGKFAASSASSIILNICQIIALVTLATYTPTKAHALAIAVIIAGILQCVAISISARRSLVMVRLIKPTLSPDVKKLLKKMLPSIIGSSALQISGIISSIIATFIPGAVSILYYAERLTQLPLALIGTAIGTVLLPNLAKHLSSGAHDQAKFSLRKAVEIGLFFSLPATFALIALAHPLIYLLFCRNEFTLSDTGSVASALVAFSFGLPAFVLNKIFTPVFFARGDTKTPLKISVASVIINIVLNLLLMQCCGFVGIAYANSIAAWSSVVLLIYVLHSRQFLQLEQETKIKIVLIILASVAMTIYLLLARSYLAPWLYSENSLHKYCSFIALIGGGILVYFLSAYYSKLFNYQEIRSIFRRQG
jgi:putative peptidoglycan lipid II flippase